jgi:hypothetical protein
MRSRCIVLAVAAAVSISVLPARADADLENEVHNGIKGAIGLGLIGAELPLIIEGAAGVRNPWLLTLIPIVVAAGGAVGGWYLGEASPEGSVATLVVGLALIIPAALLVSYGRSYRPSRDEDEGFVDRTEEGQPDEDEYLERPPAVEEGTDTEVVGPEEDSGEVPAPAEEPAPASDEESGGDQASAGPARLAAVRLDGNLPVGGLLRILADELDARRSPRLDLRPF